MSKVKLKVGTVIKDCQKELRGLEGIQLLVIHDEEGEFLKDLCLLYPIKYDEIDKFYRFGFEGFGKKEVSDDFNYFIWYMLNSDCEFSSSIDMDQLENVREVTKEEDHEAYINIEKFKFNHKFYDKEVTYQDVKITKELIDNVMEVTSPCTPPMDENTDLESLKCFEFDGGEKDYIIADCFNNAMRYYIDMMEERTLTEEEYKVQELEEWKEQKMKNEEDNGTFKVITFLEAVKEAYPNEYNVPTYLASTCN